MATVHTTARGTEPYDKVYCLGYQVHHEDWSPYPRINKLRQTFLDRGYDVDVERLRLVTESYQQHEHLPEKLKVAYAFENVLLHCGIEIYDDDLIVGEIASPVKSAPIYPEFSVNWILDEVQNHPFEEREHDQFYIRNEKEKQEILDLCSWWKGRTLDDYINVRLDDDQLKGSEAGKKIYQTNLYHYAGTGHLAVDYARLMRLGFDGLLEQAKQKLAALDMHDPEFCTKREFYQAVIIMHSAVKKYIERYANRVPASAALVQAVQNAQTAPAAGEIPEAAGPYAPLMKAVEKGLKGEASARTRALLEEKEPLELVDEALIPALDIVGAKYEKGTLFLPQLLQAATAAQGAFEEIKTAIAQKGEGSASKGRIVLATVKGDVHDIGKNIVRVILENYGFEVLDLGRDVPVETVVDTVREKDVHLVGLSALMTTTLKSMEETIAALRAAQLDCKIMVGGAVLTPEYAEKIGADWYAKDAKRSADIAKEFFGV